MPGASSVRVGDVEIASDGKHGAGGPEMGGEICLASQILLAGGIQHNSRAAIVENDDGGNKDTLGV